MNNKVELVKRIFYVFALLVASWLAGCAPEPAPDLLAQKIVPFEQYRLVYTPGQLPPETLLQLAVDGEAIQSVRGEIVGLDMSMGKIPLFFQKDEKGQFVAQFLLGVCSEPDMFWQVRLKITDTAGKEREITDKFQAFYQ